MSLKRPILSVLETSSASKNIKMGFVYKQFNSWSRWEVENDFSHPEYVPEQVRSTDL